MAAVSIGIPKPLALLTPPIWEAEAELRACKVPVLVMHGEKDRLFPARMAKDLAGFCGPHAELAVIPGVAHNQPFRRPSLAYWGMVISWLLEEGAPGC
jgi:pimeloyl-ACP methyl ester carboxylesterase